MSKRSKACDITPKVKAIVYERDNHCCIVCGCNKAYPNAHYISRAKGGLGIEQNVVTLCINCHHEYDNGNKGQAPFIKEKIKEYLQSYYEDWNEEKLYYKKEY